MRLPRRLLWLRKLNRKRAYEPPAIPDRLYFKIGDVARLCGVETYVLRFWESQFPQLKPNKSGTGQRLYRRRDVEMALEIKRLVHAEGYTLAGARTVLEQGQRRQSPRADSRSDSNPDSRPDLSDGRQADLPSAPGQASRWTRQPRPSVARAPSCARLPHCWVLRCSSRRAAAAASPDRGRFRLAVSVVENRSDLINTVVDHSLRREPGCAAPAWVPPLS